jgi:hypothetical protein
MSDLSEQSLLVYAVTKSNKDQTVLLHLSEDIYQWHKFSMTIAGIDLFFSLPERWHLIIIYIKSNREYRDKVIG